MTEKIRAFVCRNGMSVVEEIGNDLKSMQAIVGGYVEHVTMTGEFRGLHLWLNEDGRLRPFPVWLTPFHPQPLAGDFFITRDDAEGELASLRDEDIELLYAAIDRSFSL